MIDKIIQLMELEIHVAIVTVAGYPGSRRSLRKEPEVYWPVQKQKLPPNITKYFHVMGGECNYLLNVNEIMGFNSCQTRMGNVEQYGWREGKDLQAFLDRARFSWRDTRDI